MTKSKKGKKKKLKKLVKNSIGVIIILLFFLAFKTNLLLSDNVESITGPNKIFLALNEKETIPIQVKVKNDSKYKINYSYDDAIISIADNVIEAKKIGNTEIIISSKKYKKRIEVVVTDLIETPTINEEKPFLSCRKYSQEDAEIIDDILETKVESAGLGTRAGVVAAARFLSLQFPYKINYFFENGRLSGTDRDYIDGEGRYYHKGLYLDESKYKSIVSSTDNPVMWGCDLYSVSMNTYSRNGLNCSGFISWTMLNGGFDIGDIGAGMTDQFDFTDIGEKEKITIDLLSSGRIKVGDLIGRDGHIAIIIGLENDKVYIAESYIPSIKIRTFSYDELLNSEDFNYIMLMDLVYKEDGNITNMW